MNLFQQGLSDQKFLNDVYCSTFKNDYINSASVGKQKQIEPPKPAQILHKDYTLDMSSSVSMARSCLPVKKFTREPPAKDLIFETNFKLGDVEKIPICNTVTSSFFKPVEKIQKKVDTKARANKFMQSHVPNGDTIKNVIGDESVYKQQFKGVVTEIPKRAQSRHYYSLKSQVGHGDPKFNAFKTSTQQSHKRLNLENKILGPLHSKLEANKLRSDSSVPTGDRFHWRNATKAAMVQESFPKFKSKDIMDASITRKNLVDDRYYTSIILAEPTSKHYKKCLNRPATENAARYTVIPPEQMYPLERTNVERNHSDIPQGDEVHHMQTMKECTYNNKVYPKPPIIIKDRSKSFVNFGSHVDADLNYLSTTDASYLPHESNNSPQKYLKTQSTRTSNVSSNAVQPLPFKKNEMSTITQVDFNCHDKYKKLSLNSKPLENLKCSHWHQPLGNQRFFDTRTDRYQPIGEQIGEFKNYRTGENSIGNFSTAKPDVGLLQKSNVPLGTMGKYIDGYHCGWY